MTHFYMDKNVKERRVSIYLIINGDTDTKSLLNKEQVVLHNIGSFETYC